MWNFDPLSQFEIVNLTNFLLVSEINNFTATLLIIFTLFTLLLNFNIVIFKQNLINSIIFISMRFVNKIMTENTNVKRSHYFLVLYFLFIFILITNFVGLLPFSWAATSSFAVTLFLSFSYFFMLNFVAVWEKKDEYFALFLPNGVPALLAPLIVVIEVVSYFSRIFSLSIRLFANISSGHALLKILIGFSWAMLNVVTAGSLLNGGLLIISSLFPWVLVTLIFFLEILISFLQSYVFVILISIYINDVTGDSH
jgi:ATP synthase subunit 6